MSLAPTCDGAFAPVAAQGAPYVVVFDAADRVPELWWAGIGLVFVVFGLYLWRSAVREPPSSWWHGWLRDEPEARVASALFITTFAAIWTALATYGILRSYSEMRDASRDDSAYVVEGVVQDLEPNRPHGRESFVVDGVHFEYSEHEVTGAFNYRSVNGGPIREGLQVRIHYVDLATGPQIVRLEIRR